MNALGAPADNRAVAEMALNAALAFMSDLAPANAVEAALAMNAYKQKAIDEIIGVHSPVSWAYR